MTNNLEKKIIIGTIIFLIPLIFMIIVIAVKSSLENNKQLTRYTYVHVFYVNNTDSKEKIEETLNQINDNFKIVYHDISEEGELYKNVLDYLGITVKVYNPLIMINNDYFTEEYDLYSLENSIKISNETYQKENLTKEEINNYDIVDKLA